MIFLMTINSHGLNIVNKTNNTQQFSINISDDQPIINYKY